MSSVHSSFCPYLPIVCPAAILSYLFVPDGCFSIGLLTTPLCQLFASSSLHRFNKPLPLFPFNYPSLFLLLSASELSLCSFILPLVHLPPFHLFCHQLSFTLWFSVHQYPITGSLIII